MMGTNLKTVSPDDKPPEKARYYVVLGGKHRGVYLLRYVCYPARTPSMLPFLPSLTQLYRPQATAVGYHVENLPLVVVCQRYSQAREVDTLNADVVTRLQDPMATDPEELISRLKASVVVKKLFVNSSKLYAVKVGKETGIFVDADWCVPFFSLEYAYIPFILRKKDIAPLIKYKQADHKSFHSFIDALKWMLDKEHMRPVTASETEDEAVSYADDTEDEGPPPSPSPSPPPLMSHRSMRGAATPTPSRSSSPTKPVTRSSSPVKQEVPTAHLPRVAEDRASVRVPSPSKGLRFQSSAVNVESPAVPLERTTSSPAAYLTASYSISSASRIRRTGPFLGAPNTSTTPFTASASASAARTRFPSAMDAAAGMSICNRSMASSTGSFLAAISISDDEDWPVHRLAARDLQRVLRPATMGPDGVLIDGAPVANLGREAELFCDGLRMPAAHRTLVLQVYVFSDSCEDFTRTLSRAPVNLTLGEGEKLWGALAAVIPPSV